MKYINVNTIAAVLYCLWGWIENGVHGLICSIVLLFLVCCTYHGEGENLTRNQIFWMDVLYIVILIGPHITKNAVE